MAKRLSAHVTSDWVSAANRMASHKAKRRVVAYVESYDDIAFWRNLFSAYESDRCTFQVMLPSSTSLSKGKKVALMNTLGEAGLGKDLIACVDSDYDYLLQGVTRLSRRILHNPYILHTYTYAIENYQCYAESLHEVCVQATLNDRRLLDFPAWMARYSEVVHPLFLWSVMFYRHDDLNTFSLLDFCSYVRVEGFSLRRPYACLDRLAEAVCRKAARLAAAHPDYAADLPALDNELRGLGVRPDNTYLYMQGHHVMDNVVLRVLFPVCTQLRREREREIERLAEHDMQFRNELTCYQHSQCGVDLMLRRNTRYEGAEPYRRLRRDLEHLLSLKQPTRTVD